MPITDVTFVHAPAIYDFRERSTMFGPVSDMVPSTPIFEMYPLGFTTMSDYLERYGLSARIYNLAGMMLHKKNFNVEQELSRLKTNVFGIDCHWMPHCQGSVEVAKILKRLHPDVPVFFGGLSSTIFHEEMIRYDCIDYVIRGDSTEEPLRRLISRLVQAKKTKTPVGDLSDIPNLTWKDSTGAIHVNPLTWVPDSMNSISLDYTYPMKGVIRHRDMMSYVPFKNWLQYPVVATLCSRGCDRNCATCGGSHYTFKEHFGRDKTAWRDPELLVHDIENVQKHIWGPIFVLNDFLQAGPEMTEKFITGLKGKLKNPIGFEFFGPPKEGKDFYKLLNNNLDNWSIEISAESHDDEIRTAFGKGHYKMEELEETIIDALDAGAQRFDLYFMTGIPKQTKESVLETGEYVRHLYERVNYDPRLLVFTSPMAPFLDVGSRAFDNPEKFGYRLKARTFEEHRRQMLQPSWKHIMNYESLYMNADDMVEATYQAALDINQVKRDGGLIPDDVAAQTDKRIREAREQMRRLDELIEKHPESPDEAMRVFKEENLRLSENTVAEKSDLNWPHELKLSHIGHLAWLGISSVVCNIGGFIRGRYASAASKYPYPEQVNSGEKPSTNKIFARIAKRYDRFNVISSMGICRIWRKKTVQACDANSNSNILDLAAGTGDITFALARESKPAHIMSTDLCPEMLDVAKEAYEKDQDSYETKIDFQVVDAMDIPFDDESFDAVSVAYGVRNIPDRPKAFAEALRVLKPGGRYVILEFSQPKNPVWRALYHVYLRFVIPTVGKLVTGDSREFKYLRSSILAFPAAEELKEMLEEAGFSEVSYISMTGGIAAVHIAIK